MFEENILEGNFNDEELLSDDSIFEDDVLGLPKEEDEDAVEFESYDDSTPDW